MYHNYFIYLKTGIAV